MTISIKLWCSLLSSWRNQSSSWKISAIEHGNPLNIVKYEELLVIPLLMALVPTKQVILHASGCFLPKIVYNIRFYNNNIVANQCNYIAIQKVLNDKVI